MDNRKYFTNHLGIVSFFTFLSRIVGYLRDIVVAFLFGAGFQTDAFYVAFRIPNLLRRLFAEGALTAAFIPIFTEYLELKDEEEAKKALNSIFSVLFIILVGITALGVVLAPYIIKLYAYGFTDKTFDIAVKLNRIMFPYILFISLTALGVGVLNSLKHFFAPAFSPVIFNITMILCALFLHTYFEIPIMSIAIGVIIGGILQLALIIYFLKSKRFLFRFSKLLRHKAVKRVSFLMVPQLFGIAVYNLNIVVNTQFASFMPTGTVTYLYFAERLVEFPLGIVAVSIATVMLPALSADATRDNFDQFNEKYIDSLRLMFYVMVPATVGLILLKEPICNVLYQHGQFDYNSVVKTSEALLGYGFGLLAVSGIRITVPAFYALKDMKTPVFISFAAFIVNFITAYILGFVFGLNHLGLALASSVSSIINFSLLLYFLSKRQNMLFNFNFLKFILKVIFISILMGLIVLTIVNFYHWDKSGISTEKIFYILSSLFLGIGSYLLFSKLFGLEEYRSLLSMIKRKKVV